MSSEAERDLDLVLVGASGFVGRLTARHLAEHAPAALRIGLAGRSADRLAATRESLPERAADWPLITVDVLDDAAVARLATRARVVASTVGPYLRYGLPLVRACAEAGTHYADLTGETVFVRRSIDAAHRVAGDTGARIVHSCGFDSVPSDLGVGLTAAHAAENGGRELEAAVLHVRSLRGGISGGTIDSLRQQVIESERIPELRRLMGEPQALVDDLTGTDYGATAHRRPVARDPHTGAWHAPFVMGPYNGQIVHRSNALTDWAYGREFSYHEVVDTGRGPAAVVAAAAIAVGTGALTLGMSHPVTRALLDRVLPEPGEGPSDKQRAAGRFAVTVVVQDEDESSLRTTIAADRDPGYDATAVMLGESALALAAGDELGPAGVVTPWVALGAVLPDRLRSHGFRIGTERVGNR